MCVGKDIVVKQLVEFRLTFDGVSSTSIQISIIAKGDAITKENAAERNEIEPEGGEECVHYPVDLLVEPSRPGEVVRIDIDVQRPRLRSIQTFKVLCLFNGLAIFVLLNSMRSLLDINVILFAAFLQIILPFCWYFNFVALKFEASRTGC